MRWAKINKILLGALIILIFGLSIGVSSAAGYYWIQTDKSDYEGGWLVDVDTESTPGDVKLAAVAISIVDKGVPISGANQISSLTTGTDSKIYGGTYPGAIKER